MASYGDGFSNFAAAIGNYMAARKRRQADREDREDRKLEREERRADMKEERAFKREMAEKDLSYRQDYLDRAMPKKGMLDRVMEGVQTLFKPASPQDNLTNAQAGLVNTQADVYRKMMSAPGMAANMGIPTTVPGSIPGMPRNGMRLLGAPKPPKQPKQQKDQPDTYDGTSFTQFASKYGKAYAGGVFATARKEGRILSGDDLAGAIAQSRKLILEQIPTIEEMLSRRLSQDEIEALIMTTQETLKSEVPIRRTSRPSVQPTMRERPGMR
jgi:hypothetical protein